MRSISAAELRRSISICALLGALAALSIVTDAHASIRHRYWVLFRDKGFPSSAFRPGAPEFEAAKRSLSQAAIERRMKAEGASAECVLELADAPVCAAYLDSLSAMGALAHVVSRWENAVSIEADSGLLARISGLHFVEHIQPVATSRTMQETAPASFEFLDGSHGSLAQDTIPDYNPVIYRYGHAQSQLDRINVWPLHAMGLDATSVLLGFLDTGFRWRELESLRSKRVLFEHDYIFGDSVTENQDSDILEQQTHGTTTLCTSTGYAPDSTIGPAYNVKLLLAKTEDIRSETPREEDNYVAALEDFESRGVQITSSSLGYFGFDSGWTSYTKEDLNGHTTITARGLQRAAKLGVLCVTAMGNSGLAYMLTPADADSIISVGALDVNDSIAGFSSRGPAADGRIKPEICAPGVFVWAQHPDGNYYHFNGTSYATPLTSGACCLIMQSHPEATAQSIRKAIMQTGNNAEHPDTTYGWGKLNAYAAALRLGPIVNPMNAWYSGGLHVIAGAASEKKGIQVSLLYHTESDTNMRSVALHLVKDSLIYDGATDALPPGELIHYQLSVIDGEGGRATSAMQTIVVPGQKQSVAVSVTPAVSGDLFTLAASLPGTWTVCDASGRTVLAIVTHAPQERLPFRARELASGIYFLRFSAVSGESRMLRIAVSH